MTESDCAGAARNRAALRRATVDARTALEDAAQAAAAAAVHARTVAEMLDEALAVMAAPAPLAPRQAGGFSAAAADLSPREREVLALVAEGRSNKAIAETLYVSPNTVKTHVASLLGKLQAGSRVQLAVLAARQ